MELEFYRLYEQIDEHHYEETYYHIGPPSKPFKETIEEAKELFLLRASEGEDVHQWKVIIDALLKAGYHPVEHKDTHDIYLGYAKDVRSLCEPIRKRRLDGHVFVASETFKEVNEIRLKYGKPPLHVDDFLFEDEPILPCNEEDKPEIRPIVEPKPEPPRTLEPDDFRMDELDAFLPNGEADTFKK